MKQKHESRDVFGRTLLHCCVLHNDPARFLAALRGDGRKLVTAVDYQSGWNVLHYILFYRRVLCLQVLLAHLDHVDPKGALVWAELLGQKDRMKQTPAALLGLARDLHWVPTAVAESGDYVVKPRYKSGTTPRRRGVWWHDARGARDFYVFGLNANYTLGEGLDRLTPQRVAVGSKTLQTGRLRSVHVARYHAVAVTTCGSVYTCGRSTQGRLGHVQKTTRYTAVPGLDSVAACAVSDTHTAVLTPNGVYVWGANPHGQLGTSALYEPAPVALHLGPAREQLQGVAVSDIHTLAYSSDTLYAVGLDVGQFGSPVRHPDTEARLFGRPYKGRHLPGAVAVPFRAKIRTLATCATATCIVTAANDLYVLSGGETVRLPRVSPKIANPSFDCFQPSCLTSVPAITKVSMRSPDHVHVLLDLGDVLWFAVPQSNIHSLRSAKLTTVWLASYAQMRATDIATALDGLLAVVANGEVYLRGTTVRRMPALGQRKRFVRVDGVSNVAKVACDDSFASFAFLRDDVDVLPFQLTKNDFFGDMALMSPVGAGSPSRKQRQLFAAEDDPAVYEARVCVAPNEASSGTVDAGATDDILWQSQLERYTRVRAPTVADSFEKPPPPAFVVHEPLFTDACISVKHHSFIVPVHRAVLELRSSFCKKLFHPKDPHEYFVHRDVKGSWDASTNTLYMENVLPRSVMVLVHLIYTNTMLEISPEHQGEVFDLLSLFHLDHTGDRAYLEQLQASGSDVTIQLSDGEITCLTLIAFRSAFFEAALSYRWDPSSPTVISLENVTTAQMQLILKHLCGCPDAELLDDMALDYDDPDELIMALLDLVAVADELLLVPLKHLCELAIGEFLHVDNVLVVAAHASALGAHMLMANCCWYIYSNMAVLFDSVLKDVDEKALGEMERHLRFLDQCRHSDSTPLLKPELIPPFQSLADLDNVYMSDIKGYSSFPLVVEIRVEEERRRSRRMSRKGSAETGLQNLKLRSESAIDDDEKPVGESTSRPDKQERQDEQERPFEVVTVRRGSERRLSEAAAKTTENPETMAPRIPERIPERKLLAPSQRSPLLSEGALDDEQREPVPKPRSAALRAGSSSALTPLLGENVASKKSARIKFAPPKLSQKERRRRESGRSAETSGAESEGETVAKSPWNVAGSAKGAERHGSSERPGPSDRLSSLPVLGQAAPRLPVLAKRLDKLPILGQAPAPKPVETPTKTLQEIQQEQEFAKWWEEESRRVQQMTQPKKKPIRGRGRQSKLQL